MNWNNYNTNNRFSARNGADELSVTLIVTGILCLLAYPIFTTPWIQYAFIALGVVLIGVAVWRSLSTNVGKRRAENSSFITFWRGKTKEEKEAEKARKIKRKEDEKTYAYFFCPKCRKELRVPRGKGKIRIKCPNCSEQFIRKT